MGAIEKTEEQPPPAYNQKFDVEKDVVNTSTDVYGYDDTSSQDEVPGFYKVFTENSVLAKLRDFEVRMDKKFGVESRGPSRVLPEEKDPKAASWRSQLTMCFLWASGTMNLSCFATGIIGSELGLDLSQTIPITIFATLIGASMTGWCATMGPEMGLRQVSIARYSFGWWPAKLIALFNVICQIGWCAVGCITGGQALSAVSDGHVDVALGIVIVAVCGLVFSVFGLRAVMAYDKYAWMLFFLIFMIMYGEAAPKADIKTKTSLTGADNSASCLTLFAIVYGSSASWASIVSDYYIEYPVNTNKFKVYALTTAGVGIPTCIGMLLGCCVGSALANIESWETAWEGDDGLGYLIQTMLYPIGFAKFILVLLVLSVIGMFCISVYSAALSVQQFSRPLGAIPRFFWTIIVFAIILVLALAGRKILLDILENFLSLLGYCSTSFFVIVFTEHYFFRDGWNSGCANYDLSAWNTPSKLPIGIAGFWSFWIGIIGAVVGMQETYYTGPIAAKIGAYGGDIGNELALVFSLIVYIPLRIFEKKMFGR